MRPFTKSLTRTLGVMVLLLCSSPLLFGQSLSGTYTVDTTGNGDFNSISSAAQALNNNGVSGAVTINIEPGIYNERVELDSIVGTSSQNTVTFQSSTQDTSDVIVVQAGSRDTLVGFFLQKSDHVRFQHMTVVTNSTLGGSGVLRHSFMLNSGVTNVTIQHCKIDSREEGVHLRDYNFFINESIKNITIKNNVFVDKGIALLGNSPGRVENFDLVNNLFQDGGGVFLSYSDDILIQDNDFQGDGGGSAILGTASGNMEILSNKIYNYVQGIDIITSMISEKRSLIVNNFIQVDRRGISTPPEFKGDFYFNSILGNVNSSSIGYTITLCDECTYKNNIFANYNDGMVVFIQDTVEVNSDHNDFYTTGNFLGASGESRFSMNNDTIQDFAAFKQLTGTDQNSLNKDPQFRSSNDLHIAALALKDAGTPVSGVTKDIDGDSRDPQNPDIGADEAKAIVNLMANSLSLSTDTITSGKGVSVSYSATNEGSLKTNKNWTDGIYLSKDQKFDEKDQLLQSISNQFVVSPSGNYSRTGAATIPFDSSGQYYILVALDHNKVLFEDDTGNVKVSSPLYVKLAPRPELKVQSISLPNSTFSGKKFKLQWQVKNEGQEATQKAWQDKIYAANDSMILADPNQFNADSLFLTSIQAPVGLQPGETYSSSATITLPIRYSGPRYYKVITDANDAINEKKDGWPDNSSVSDPMVVQQTPLPDLEVDQFFIQQSAYSGDYVDYSFTIQNTGNAQTLSREWEDRIFFSKDTALNSKKEMESVEHYGLLEDDSTYTVQDSFKLDDCLYDTFFVYLVTDVGNQTFELSERNNTSVPDTFEVLIRPKPDLKITGISNQTASPSSSKSIQVQYTVKNDGFDEASHFKGWTDRFLLSQKGTYDDDNAILIGGNYRGSALPKDSSYTEAVSMTLPDTTIGDHYLYGYTDYTDRVCEVPNEGNNTARSPQFSIDLTPPSDLKVSKIDNVSDLQAGALWNLNFEVSNQGQGQTLGNEWIDYVYLVKDGESLEDAESLIVHRRNYVLPDGQSYQVQNSVSIPLMTEEGQYQIAVKTDKKDAIYEHQNEGNNVTYSNQFQVSRDYSEVSDLSVTQLNTSGQMKSGSQIQVDYTVQNLSKGINVTSWFDKIYLLTSGGSVIKEKGVYHFGALDSLATYTKQESFVIPHGLEGNYDLRVETDTTQRVKEYLLSNNSERTSVNIQLTTPPDLTVKSVTRPDTARAGQKLSLSWETANKGQGDATDTSWYDHVYLSKDTFLSNNDVRLGRTAYQPGLVSGNSYPKNIYPRVPVYVTGHYYVLVHTDHADAVYEHKSEGNNVGHTTNQVYIYQPQPADLKPLQSGINYDSSSGDLTYQVQNVSANKAWGSWTDFVYLSEDDEWDEGDRKVDTFNVAHKPLAAGNGYSQSDFLDLPKVKPGYYHFIVKTDGFNYIPESNVSNNAVVSDSFYVDQITDLKLDSLYTANLYRGAPSDYYEVNRPSNIGMIVELMPGNKDVSSELYHKKEAIPDRNNYDNKYDKPYQADQRIIVPTENQSVNDFLYAYGSYLPANQNQYDIIAHSAQYSIQEISPESGGQYGNVTCRIRGFDFTDSMDFALRTNQDTIPAFFVNVESSTSAIAHFDLRTYDTGKYDVVGIKPSGNEAVMQNGFQVEQNGTGESFVKMIQPSIVRPNSDFSVQVYYGNKGNINLYDNWLVVAFANDSFETSDFDVSYAGSSVDKYYNDFSNHPMPPNDSNLVDVDGITFYVLWLPILPANGQSELTFQLEAHFEGTLYAHAYMMRQPISAYTFSGRMDQIGNNVTFREIGGLFTDQPELLSQNKQAYDCEDFNYENIRDDLGEEVINVAKNVHPSRILSEPGRNVFQKARNTVINEAKSNVQDRGKQAVRDWIKDEDKGMWQETKDFFSDVKSGDAFTSDPPFSDQIDMLGECIDNNVNQEELIDDCFRKLENTAFGTIYRPNPSSECCDNCDDGDSEDGGETESQEPKDPNKIVGPDGITDMKYIKEDDRLVYTIYFENRPSAQVPAQRVTIENPLQEDFRLQNFELMEVGFGDTIIQLPNAGSLDKKYALGPEYDNNLLQVNAGLNVISSEAFWRLTTLDPQTKTKPADPNSGFLPPNDSTGQGEGYVKYAIQLESGVSSGKKINNQASITFDQAETIKTNTWTNVVVGSEPQSSVQALPPFKDTTSFVVEWSGIDGEPFGAGIRGYDVYYSTNNGSYERWLKQTSREKAVFEGSMDSTYRFYSIAYTKDGEVENAPDSFDAKTTIKDTATTIDDGSVQPVHEANMNVYPNPTKGGANISLYMSEAKTITLSVYSLMGKKIQAVHEGALTKGNHHFRLNTRDMSEYGNLYFIVLNAGNQHAVKKLIRMQ